MQTTTKNNKSLIASPVVRKVESNNIKSIVQAFTDTSEKLQLLNFQQTNLEESKEAIEEIVKVSQEVAQNNSMAEEFPFELRIVDTRSGEQIFSNKAPELVASVAHGIGQDLGDRIKDISTEIKAEVKKHNDSQIRRKGVAGLLKRLIRFFK